MTLASSKPWIFVSTVLLTFTTLSFARLGETKAELEKRLGKATLSQPANIFTQGKNVPVGEKLMFTQDGWYINATLISNKCAVISYSKVSDFTSEQMQKLLQSNIENLGWLEDVKQSNTFKRVWLRFDGATAVFDKINKSMQFTTRAYPAQVQKVQEEERKKAAKVPEF